MLTAQLHSRHLPSTFPLLPRARLVVFFPCKSRVTTSGHFADTFGLTGYDPNSTNSQNLVAWSETQNFYGAQAAYGSTFIIFAWTTTCNCTEEANAHDYRSILTEQHVYWQEQSRNALSSQQAGSERAAQACERAARVEVHVAVAQATDMSRAEMWTRMCVLANQAGQTWTSHQVSLLSEMNSVAGDALEYQKTSLLSEASAEFQRDQRHSREHLQEDQQSVSTPHDRSSATSPRPAGCEQRRSGTF